MNEKSEKKKINPELLFFLAANLIFTVGHAILLATMSSLRFSNTLALDYRVVRHLRWPMFTCLSTSLSVNQKAMDLRSANSNFLYLPSWKKIKKIIC